MRNFDETTRLALEAALRDKGLEVLSLVNGVHRGETRASVEEATPKQLGLVARLANLTHDQSQEFYKAARVLDFTKHHAGHMIAALNKGQSIEDGMAKLREEEDDYSESPEFVVWRGRGEFEEGNFSLVREYVCNQERVECVWGMCSCVNGYGTVGEALYDSGWVELVSYGDTNDYAYHRGKADRGKCAIVYKYDAADLYLTETHHIEDYPEAILCESEEDLFEFLGDLIPRVVDLYPAA